MLTFSQKNYKQKLQKISVVGILTAPGQIYNKEMKTRVIVDDIRPALILLNFWCNGTLLIKFETDEDFEDLNPENF